jgi:hypothetical protein
MSSLLAVDAGLRTGLALYGDDGRLRWYRSQHFGSMDKLKRAVNGFLREIEDVKWLVIEGGGDILDIWVNIAKRRKLKVKVVTAEKWREKLMYIRERRSGVQAKQFADGLARQVIVWSDAPKPTSLRHDTAEAILVGLWGVLAFKILKEIPEELHRR